MRAITSSGGVPIPLEPNGIGQAFALLQSGQKVKVSGASGPLDFVPNTDDPVVNIDVQIICHGTSGALEYRSSGRYFDASTGALVGAIMSCP